MFRPSKYFIIIAMVLIFIAVAILSWVFRYVALNDLLHQSEEHNRILTKTIANSIWPQISGLSRTISRQNIDINNARNQENTFTFDMIKVMLDEPVHSLLDGTNVVRIKLFNINNTVIYSTNPENIGDTKPHDYVALNSAKNGIVHTEIEKKETFKNAKNEVLHNIYVVSSYLPVMSSDEKKIEGIFEIYSDVTSLYGHLNESQRNFALMLFFVLFSIFVIIQIIVKRLDAAIQKNISLTVEHDTAKQANKAKSNFLANMSHELRTPLNAIIGYSEIIEEEALDSGNSETAKDVSKIHSAAHHLLYLINDILDLSKIEAGQMQVHNEEVNINYLMSDIISMVKPMFLANQNEFEYTCDCDKATIQTDMLKLRQMLLNLLSNAAKFCHNGKISINIFLVNQTLEAVISDTGIGLSAQQISQLYKPFVQADNSTTRKYGGTGLGLAITKQFCEMLGGRISVNSAPGAGTTFMLQVPDVRKFTAEHNIAQNHDAA